VSTYESGQDGTSAEAIADVGRAIASDDVTDALRSSERLERETNHDEQPTGEKVPRRLRTSTVAEIRRELLRPHDGRAEVRHRTDDGSDDC
jgi:hypothetical protein